MLLLWIASALAGDASTGEWGAYYLLSGEEQRSWQVEGPQIVEVELSPFLEPGASALLALVWADEALLAQIGLAEEDLRVAVAVPEGAHRLSLSLPGGEALVSLDLQAAPRRARAGDPTERRAGLALALGSGLTPAGEALWSAGVRGQLLWRGPLEAELGLSWRQASGGAILSAQPALGGGAEIDARWLTRALALEPGLSVGPRQGQLLPQLSAGPGLSLALRSGAGAEGAALAPGYFVRAELKVPVPGGHLSPSLAWSSARADFGNPSADGSTASERLEALRVEMSWSVGR